MPIGHIPKSAAGPPEWPYRLGKKAARPGAIRYSLARYVNLSLPKPPQSFRHGTPPLWGEYGGSRAGNCVWAGAANETRLWEHEGFEQNPSPSEFTEQEVNSDYSAVAGYDPSRPDTDGGTDMGSAAAYRKNTGILGGGTRHKVDAYAKLALGNIDHLKAAMWVLGGIGIGFKFPKYAMRQYTEKRPWAIQWSWARLLGQDDIQGGHYVPGIGVAENGNIICISWGREQEMEPEFYLRFADEVIAWLDLDRLGQTTRLSPEGFAKEKLLHDLSAVAQGRVYALQGD